MRIIQSKRDSQSGENYHYCPVEAKNLTAETCRTCPYGKVEDLTSRYRIHCSFKAEGVELIEFEPPKAHDSSAGLGRGEVINSERHSWVEPKLDGARAIVHCTPDGVFITSRRRDKAGKYNQFQDNVPHLRDHPLLKAIGAGGYSIFDGEVMMDEGEGGSLSSTMSVVGSKPERAIEVQKKYGNAALHLFDVARYKGHDATGESLEARRRILENTFGGDESISLVPVKQGQTSDQKQTLFTEALESGQEGLVIKDPTATYTASHAWLKVKQHVTIDAQVTGWEMGKTGGKYAHTLGALKVSVVDEETGTLREIANVIPGDNDLRDRLFAQLQVLSSEEIEGLGMVIELEGQGFSQEYRIRHPRIVRYREDRSEPNSIDFTKVVRI